MRVHEIIAKVTPLDDRDRRRAAEIAELLDGEILGFESRKVRKLLAKAYLMGLEEGFRDGIQFHIQPCIQIKQARRK